MFWSTTDHIGDCGLIDYNGAELKIINEQKRQRNNQKIDTDNSMSVNKGKEGERGSKRLKGVKYMVREGELTLGSKDTMQYTDDEW